MADTIYQLKITLDGSKPPIWRRIQINSTIKLGELHNIILATMGWLGGHMHQFSIDGIDYGHPDPGLDFQDENKATLSKLVRQEKTRFSYTYDFGDNWEHRILLEKILPCDKSVRYPICLKGKRACPPEDCGGIWGYADLLEVLQNPEHPEYDEMSEWYEDGIDPDDFTVEEVNQRLSSLSN